MDYILLLISVLFAVSNNGLLHAHGGMDKQSKSFFFNAVVSAVWFVGLLSIRNIHIRLSPIVIGFGVLYGIVQAFFLYFKMQAMANGPVSVTTLIGTCSFVLSTVSGILIWSERITALQGVGLCLLMCSVLLCVNTGNSAEKKASLKWIFYCAGFFLASASVGIVFKFFSKSNSGNATDMMIVTSFVMTVAFLILGKPLSNCSGMGIAKRDLIFALLCGIVSCAYNRTNIYLTGALPSIIFFPVFNGGVIFLSLLVGVILFKEKLSKKQLFGFALGMISLLIAGNIIRF